MVGLTNEEGTKRICKIEARQMRKIKEAQNVKAIVEFYKRLIIMTILEFRLEVDIHAAR